MATTFKYILAFAIIMSFYGWFMDKRDHPQSQQKPAYAVTPLAVERSPITEAEQAALSAALSSWEDALGPLPMDRPALVRGECVDPDALACAALTINAIVVVGGNGDEYDKKTIFIHEIGHLLGVPHIEGDPTMAPKYNGVRMGPSKFAVALAKAAMDQP